MQKCTKALLAGTLGVFLSQTIAAQQKPDGDQKPDTPAPKQDAAQQKQDKSVWHTSLGLVTRRSYVYPELARTPGPLRPVQKFELFLDKSVSPPQILGSATFAGISQARNSLPGYGQGADGYGKRFGSSMASGASSNLFGTFLLPAMLRDDPRFFIKVNGGFWSKVGYAMGRSVIIRTDAGGQTFNLPGTLGPLAAEGLANTYLPDAERTTSKTFQRYGIRIGFGAANNVAKEFWPIIFKRLGLAKIAPGLRPN